VDDGLKQRLVGALVLLALGVLFIPALLEPELSRDMDRTSRIPTAPNIQPIDIKPPVKSDKLAPSKPFEDRYRLVEEDQLPDVIVQTQNQVKAKTVTAKSTATAVSVKISEQQAKTQIIMDKDGVPRAWAVQIVSYQTQQRAQEFSEKLKRDGYQPFTKSANSSKGKVYRVYVGPKINPTMAKNLKQELDKKYKLDTLVVRFDP
jgi:DedD protein